ncbi:porin [Brucella endophytica]|uniref:Porin n=1 Tax=Brucella endophytica TaxID=1963359 RepID=A0A916WB06_9HYPH|nr:porin [Brucella endophytica]
MIKKLTITAVAVTTLLAGCTTDPYTGEQKMSKTAGGAALGAAVGALGGLAVGGSSRAQRNAVLIGAGIGALTGGAIGNYMDRQEAELRAQLQGTGVSVTRNGDSIILNMPSNITFDTDRDQVKSQFYPTLNSVAIVLRKFNQSLVDIYGHTDSTGSPSYNQQLSQRRAQSVASYLGAQGIDQRRFAVTGFGDTRPIASNASESGRAQNRRVEIQISPLAEGGQGGGGGYGQGGGYGAPGGGYGGY